MCVSVHGRVRVQRTGRRVFIEYCMLAGVNDSAECVRRPLPLSQHAWRMRTPLHSPRARVTSDARASASER
jgi:hypothetical protein